MNRLSSFLREFFPYLAVFALGGLAVSTFSPVATISRQTGISSIANSDLNPAFPLAVGTAWEYEGWIRRQQGQEQDPPRQSYKVRETVTQHDKARDGDTWLVSLKREETIEDGPTLASTVGYLTDGHTFYRIENEDGLNAVHKSLYGDDSDRDMIVEISRTPTYELSTGKEGCFRIQNKSLSSTYEEVFCAGVGPISIHYVHNGTIDEYSLTLVSRQQ